MTTITIDPVHIPACSADADAADFVTSVELRNRVYREGTGSSDEDMTPAELLPINRPSPTKRRLLWLARVDGVPVARINLDLPLETGATSADAEILVTRDAWAQGVGTAALALLEEETRRAGRTSLIGECEHPHSPGATRVASPTGHGSVARDHAALFLERRGFALEQVERKSAFDMTAPSAAIERLRDEAAIAAHGYHTISWTDAAPAAALTGLARLKQRMSTDAPGAGLDVAEEVWTPERVRDMEDRRRAAGLVQQVVAAVHATSGELVGFTELVRPVDPTAATTQADTLVLREHRGHRLGLLLKATGLISWRRASPSTPRVLTWNAEENRPMLAINEALGFTPVGAVGVWQKRLG